MSKVINNNGFTTKLNDDQFLRFADKSTMGVILIQRGCLIYFNTRFGQIFGYSKEEISNWKKFEYFKIIHPDDVPKLMQKMKIEDNKNVSLRFRGVTKKGDIINIENYICRIKYNNKYAYLSSYVLLDCPIEKNNEILRVSLEFKGDLAKNYKKYFEYLELNFNIEKKKYLEETIKDEINSKNFDLKIF
ncbi:hypothetical protein LCGC14_1619290 [marine sediment metagenome]|uniref:PAS domain-containing protein n=1 Tax=marine sediment metagenome TaxID=412755 RepID=A0A0F9I697_9ZZZZ